MSPSLLLSTLTLAAVQAEASGAHAKHGKDSVLYGGNDRRFRILGEEVGEVARELNDAEIEGREPDRDKLVRELVQSAAMCLTWVEALEGGPEIKALIAADERRRGREAREVIDGGPFTPSLVSQHRPPPFDGLHGRGGKLDEGL